MKTKSDFKTLNYLDYTFFKGCEALEAKYVFADILFPNNWQELIMINNKKSHDPRYVNSRGHPKITINDFVQLSMLDFTIKSNSLLDKTCQFGYLCDHYNKGIPLQRLREYSQNKTFIKALRFTGKSSVINQIINPEQLLKIQKTWLLKNTYMVKNWSKNCLDFINKNEWAIGFLVANMVSKDDINKQKQKLEPEAA